MATTLTGQLAVTWIGDLADASSLTTLSQKFNYNRAQLIAQGTGNNQSDLFYETLATHTSTVSYDLDSAALKDGYGNGLTFVEVRGIIIYNHSTVAGEILTVGGDFMLALGAGIARTEAIGPSGVFCRTDPIDGLTVTSTTQDVITIDAGANTISYDLFIWGTSA